MATNFGKHAQVLNNRKWEKSVRHFGSEESVQRKKNPLSKPAMKHLSPGKFILFLFKEKSTVLFPYIFFLAFPSLTTSHEDKT